MKRARRGATVVVTNGANLPASTTVTIAATALRESLPRMVRAWAKPRPINTGATSGLVTLNSTTNPANIGDTVSLFLTGEGNYNPVAF